MNILLLGGTQFIGRHVVRKLREAGHRVTLVNRGKTGPGLYPDLPRILADREARDFPLLPELKRDWDAVIDLSAYYPRTLDRFLEAIRGRAGRYILCSTLSAYVASAMNGSTPIIRESDPLRVCTDAQAVDTSMATYGERKAECERVTMRWHEAGLPAVILRPSVVFGEFDHTDRLAYWFWRASRAVPFILPDDGLTITRRTYAPDLAAAFASALTSPAAPGNAYNVAETDPLSFRDTLHWLGVHLRTQPLEHAVSIQGERLLQVGVRPWADLPLWLPKLNLLVDTFNARKDLGWISTPAAAALAEAADAFLKLDRTPQTGLSPEREAEILAHLCVK